MFPSLSRFALAMFLSGALGCNCGHQVLRSSQGHGVPGAIDFGKENLGQTKVVGNRIVLSNSAGAALQITGSSISGLDAQDFALTSALPPSVSAGSNATATLRFTPSAAGARSATIEIATDSSDTPVVDVPLTGVGVQIQVCVSPNPLDFGNVQVAGTPVSQAVTLTNCGGSDANLKFPTSVEGPNAGDYSVGGATDTALAAGQSLTLGVAFAPSAVGASTADIPYSICDGCSQQQINLSGVGVDCQLMFQPDPISFGTVNDGNRVTTGATLSNTGSTDCVIDGLTILGATSPFSLDSAPPVPFSLAPGTSQSLSVAFAPFPGSVNNDTLSATYMVDDVGVPSRTSSVSLNGNSNHRPCMLAVTPAAVYFGSVNASTVVSKQVTLTDQGDTPCSVTRIAMSAASDPGFVLQAPGTTSLTVNPGTPATIGVTFSAASISAPYLRKGTLTFQTGDASNPTATVPLNAYLNNTVYSSGWPKWHFDNRNSGQSEANTTWLQGRVAWQFNVGASNGSTYINSPVVDASGRVIQLGMSGTLFAFSPDGTQAWTASLSNPSADPHPSTPAILSDGSMYVLSGTDQNSTSDPLALYYLSSSGAILFSQTYGESSYAAAPALGNDGTLYEADDDFGESGHPNAALAYRANGGSVSLVRGARLPITGSSERFGIAVADDETTYWANNGQFFALTPPASGFAAVAGWPAAGVSLGPAMPMSEVISDLAVDGRVNNYLFAYAAWETYDQNLNVAVQGVLAALRLGDGSVAWTVSLPATSLGNVSLTASDYGNAAPAVADDGTVYVGNADGLRAVDGSNGSVRWLFRSADVTSSPAVGGDGTVFFGAADGNFYAVRPDGSLRFKVTTGGRISASPAIASDGTVYVTSDDGNLYAIK